MTLKAARKAAAIDRYALYMVERGNGISEREREMKDSGGRCLFEFVVKHIRPYCAYYAAASHRPRDKLELRIILLKVP